MYFYYLPQPHYIKKEDAKNFYNNQHKKIGVVILAMAGVSAIIQYFVLPKMLEMYDDLGLVLPYITSLSVQLQHLIAFLGFFVGIYFLLSSPDDTNLKNELKKYKAGEMINSRKLWNNKFEVWILLFLGVIVGLIVMTIIMPIYSLTSGF